MRCPVCMRIATEALLRADQQRRCRPCAAYPLRSFHSSAFDFAPPRLRGELGLCLSPRGIDLFRVDAQFDERLPGLRRVEIPIARQAGQRRAGDRFGVDLEMSPEVLAVVAAAEPIGA